MHKRIIRKIKSNKGASLSMSLLLFLVCAAIGAIVLTAATASAGRLSSLAEMDQRYYSVSSAVQLLEKQLTGKEVTIYRECKTTVTTIVDGAGDPQTSSVYVFKIGDKDATEVDSFLSMRAKKLVFGNNALQTADDKAKAMKSTLSHEDKGTFNIVHSEKDNQENTLNCTVAWNMKADGTLVLKVSDGPENNKYTLALTLVPTVIENEKSAESEPTITSLGNNTYQKSTTVTTEKTARITWSYGGIIKEVSEPKS